MKHLIIFLGFLLSSYVISQPVSPIALELPDIDDKMALGASHLTFMNSFLTDGNSIRTVLPRDSVSPMRNDGREERTNILDSSWNQLNRFSQYQSQVLDTINFNKFENQAILAGTGNFANKVIKNIQTSFENSNSQIQSQIFSIQIINDLPWSITRPSFTGDFSRLIDSFLGISAHGAKGNMMILTLPQGSDIESTARIDFKLVGVKANVASFAFLMHFSKISNSETFWFRVEDKITADLIDLNNPTSRSQYGSFILEQDGSTSQIESITNLPFKVEYRTHQKDHLISLRFFIEEVYLNGAYSITAEYSNAFLILPDGALTGWKFTQLWDNYYTIHSTNRIDWVLAHGGIHLAEQSRSISEIQEGDLVGKEDHYTWKITRQNQLVSNNLYLISTLDGLYLSHGCNPLNSKLELVYLQEEMRITSCIYFKLTFLP